MQAQEKIGVTPDEIVRRSELAAEQIAEEIEQEDIAQEVYEGGTDR